MSATRTEPRTETNGAPANGAEAGQPVLTVPGIDQADARRVIEILERRLASLLDLQLTLKHVHWNVVGVNFISVHEFLDPQVDSVRAMADGTAERIAALGGSPRGTPAAIVELRSSPDYELRREPTVRHLSALDEVYGNVIVGHRAAMTELEELDPVTQDLLIEHLHGLEQYQWFVRAHLQNSAGDVVFREREA